jgi:hypothetical protein
VMTVSRLTSTIDDMPTPLIKDLSSERVMLPGHPITIPRQFTGRVDDPGLPYIVELTIAFNGDRVQCERLTCQQRDSGKPITSTGMLQIHTAELVFRAARVAATPHDLELPPLPDRSGPTSEHLRTVSQIYAIAYACGGNPRQSVMEALGLPRSTANRWFKLAREQGFLSPWG